MRKIFKLIRNVIIGILGFVYFGIVIFISFLVLNRNDYGYTSINGVDMIFIDSTNASDVYSDGSLVLVKNKKISDINVGDNIFVYEADSKNNVVNVVYSLVSNVVINESTSYVTLDVDSTSWGDDYIAGVGYKSYEKIGKILSVLESKWIFFFALIVPIFFILLYEIYLFIITIKYGDAGEKVISDDKNDEIEMLKKELESLKNAVNNTNS